MRLHACCLLLALFAGCNESHPTAAPATVAAYLPSDLVANEGIDIGEAWTWRTFRVVLRYPAEWMTGVTTISELALRPDSTYGYQGVDRLPGRMRIWLSTWDGAKTPGWPAAGQLVYDQVFDPPPYSIAQTFTPQPWQILFPLVAPWSLPLGQGLQVELLFEGMWDPIWGNRATYWCDAGFNPHSGHGLSDQWLDTIPPYQGCGRFLSESRSWQEPNRLSLWLQGAPNTVGLMFFGSIPLVGPACLDMADPLISVPILTDPGGQTWLTFHWPTQPVDWVWQAWLWNPLEPDPLKGLGSGHYCRFRLDGAWPCQTLWHSDPASPSPYYDLNGSAWALRIQ